MGHTSGSIPQLVEAVKALKHATWPLLAEIIHIIDDPDYKPVAVAKVKHLLINTSTNLESLMMKMYEIQALLNVHSKQVAAQLASE